VLRWTKVSLSSDKASLTLTGQLAFVRHGVSWTLPAKDVMIPFAGPVPVVPYDFQPADDAAVSVKGAKLALQFPTDPQQVPQHSLTLTWRFLWGQPNQVQVAAAYDEPLLAQQGGGTTVSATLQVSDSQQIPLQLDQPASPLKPVLPNLDGGGVQIQWSDIQRNPQSPVDISKVQILPGFQLGSRPSPGFAVLSFRLNDQPGQMPSLDNPLGGFLEILFACDWGVPLQAPLTDAKNARERVFGSSAGQIDVGYTAALDLTEPSSALHNWNAKLLLNGFVEVKSLVSWPRDLLPPGTDGLVSLPPVRPDGGMPPPLNHVRHTARVLFNQHAVPIDLFTAATPGPRPSDFPILLRLRSKELWTIRAVVEHQFVAVELDAAAEPAVTATSRDLRLCLVQEVRFCAPSAFRALLDELTGVNITDPQFPSADPEVVFQSLPEVARGYLSAPMIGRLRNNDGGIVNLAEDNTMIVEASVPGLVRLDPVSQATSTNLAYLPGGTTRGFVASLGDYQSLTDDDLRKAPGSWVLLPLSFLGRTQPRDLDGLKPGGDQHGADLRVDPVLQLARGRGSSLVFFGSPLAFTLANWRDRQASTFPLAEFDMARHRLFSRLDPSSLRESWFRLNLPLPQTQPAAAASPVPQLDSVLASPVTDEPGRLGRPDVLGRLLNPQRPALPPDPEKVAPELPASGATMLAWQPGKLFVQDLAGSLPSDDFPNAVSGPVVREYSFVGMGAQVLQAAALMPQVVLDRVVVTTGGSGYTSAPPVTFTSLDGNGSGAAAIAVVDQGMVKSIALTNPGSGYTQVPTVSIGGPGSGAAATVLAKDLQRYPAATLLPASRSLPDPNNSQPVAVAVSPYLGFTLDPAIKDISEATWLVSVSELVCLDVRRQGVVSVATRIWNAPDVTAKRDALVRAWGREIQVRLAADSPVAVVRLRELYADPGSLGRCRPG
jgi:hypothetical protein